MIPICSIASKLPFLSKNDVASKDNLDVFGPKINLLKEEINEKYRICIARRGMVAINSCPLPRRITMPFLDKGFFNELTWIVDMSSGTIVGSSNTLVEAPIHHFFPSENI
jgi:hypothetical protein